MILLKILLGLVLLFVLLAVVALFVKKSYTITREITINRPVEEVYDYVRYHKNQLAFNYWLNVDANTKTKIIKSEDGYPGSTLAFESNHKKVGKGEWENTAFLENERIDFELRFIEPYAFTATGSLEFLVQGKNSTKLTWSLHSGMKWPMNIMLLFMDMDRIIGKDIEATLDNIKRNKEEKP